MKEQKHSNTMRVTKWLNKNDEGFCLSIGKLIKENHGDDSWIQTDKKDRIALFRKTEELPFIKYLI